MGDFNEILKADEKQGWLDRPERQMVGFRKALDVCALKDLGFNGFPFTWCNWWPEDHNTWILLNRVVATVDCILRFPTSHIHYINAFHSDHKPILLILDSRLKRFHRKGQPLRFESMWTIDKTCEDVIKESWVHVVESSPVRLISKKISMCQENLSSGTKRPLGKSEKPLQGNSKNWLLQKKPICKKPIHLTLSICVKIFKLWGQNRKHCGNKGLTLHG